MARLAIGADEKKKLMVLGGLLVAIVLVVGVLYFPRGSSTSEEVAEGPPPGAAPPAEESTPGGAAPADTGGSPGGITAASLVSVERYRSDPFEPFPLPPPLPTPPPPPPPPPPVMIPPPVEIVPPAAIGVNGGFALPPMGIRGSGSRPLAQLPPIVPRRVATAPTAPRLFSPPGGQTSGGSVLLSQNKRLSGVIIGDSVRALLEVTSGGTTTTRVVQPGDEVDGIRILRLERVTEAGRTITRLVVRENNQEQFVELRPAPQQAMGEGGLGLGGMPGELPPGIAPF